MNFPENSIYRRLVLFLGVILLVVSAAACQASPGDVEVVAQDHTTEPVMDLTGEFSLTPSSATAGSTVTATGTGFDANTSLELIWQSFTGSWLVEDGEYYGREYTGEFNSIANVQTDTQGNFTTTFIVPEGFGYVHDVRVVQDDVIKNQSALHVEMQVSISPTSGPVGTPITIEIKGLGWRDMENNRMVQYDNNFVGWMSTTTTKGYGKAVIPATGSPGLHFVKVLKGVMTFPYMNPQESPFVETKHNLPYIFEFTMTDGAPVLPAPAGEQGLQIISGEPPSITGGPQVWTDPLFAPVGTPMNIQARGFEAGQQIKLLWVGLSGNRITGGGWEEMEVDIATVNATDNGEFSFAYAFPDTHGGIHRLLTRVNGEDVAETVFNITPSNLGIEPSSGPQGTVIHMHLKGGGWTATENNFYLVYDNALVGYACGFNSNGDINVYMQAAGAPGWHFIDFYPGIYKGQESGNVKKINTYRIPQLTFADDHPGQPLPAFHFAFYITG